MKVKVLVAQACLTLCNPMDCSPPAPLSMDFSWQEYWSKLPFPPPGDLRNTRVEPMSLALFQHLLNPYSLIDAMFFFSPQRKKRGLIFIEHPQGAKFITLVFHIRSYRKIWEQEKIRSPFSG